MQKTIGQPLSRDGILIRVGVLVIISVMVLQTLFMSQFPFFSQMTKSIFQRWIGLPCPLCGGTRAMHALLEGDIHRALYFNWIALPVLVVSVLLIAVCLIELCLRRPLLPRFNPSRRFFTLCGVVFIALWGLQIFQSLYIPKPELLNPNGLFFKFYKFPEKR